MMNGNITRKSQTMALLLAIMLAGSVAAAVGKALVIEPKKDFTFTGSSLTGDYLYISDVVTVRGGDSGEADQVRAIRLVPAPYPGAMVKLSKGQIRNCLREAGFDMNRVELRIPTIQRLVLPAKRLSEAQLESMIRRAVEKELSALDGSLELSITGLPREINLPVEGSKIEIKPGYLRLGQTSTVGVKALVKGKVVRTVWARVRPVMNGSVVVAVSQVKRHQLLRAADLKVEKTEITSLNGVYTDPNQVIGMRARRQLRAGQVLDSRYVEEVPLINRGDKVRIELQRGFVVITALGKALESGGAQESIRIKNMATKKEIVGTVKSAGYVVVSPAERGVDL